MKPIQTTLEQSPRKNQDKRMQTAFRIYQNFKDGNFLIHKTTRAGCTTALVAESLNRDEKFVCIVPTNWIADKTVVADSKKYSDIDNADIIHIPSNHECLLNQRLCEDFPDLRKLPILPLAGSCAKCEKYDECDVTSVLRRKDAKGVVVTYKKLAALLLASNSRPNTLAEQVLEVINSSKNIILDEVHEIQFGESSSINVYDDVFHNRINLDKYNLLFNSFPYMRRVVTQFSLILKDPKIKNSIHEVLGGAEDKDFWKHHLNISLNNPSVGIVDGENETKVIVGAYNEIIELTKARESYKLEMEDVLDLYTMMSIVMSKVVSINAIRDDGIIKINLSAVDQATIKMIQSYTMSMQSESRRIFLTSATICSYDYGRMFMGGVKPKKISFGVGGDPMNTNSKMLILADSKKYHMIGNNSIYNQRTEIVSRVVEILDKWGDENCVIVTINTKEATKLKKSLDEVCHPHEVSYYKSPDMMGVSSQARVMIAIGVANKPSNAFDVVTTDTYSSKRMLYESVHCDTWQAWSRVKDPQAIVPSLVFALGCSVNECEALTTWGYDRKVNVEYGEDGKKKKITVQYEKGMITKPLIKRCSDFNEMMKEAYLHKQSKKSDKNAKKALIYKEYSINSAKMSYFLDSSIDLIKLIINRDDAYAIQKPDGSYLKVKSPVSKNVIEKHLRGEITLGAYQFNVDNTVKWICFDIDSHAPKGVTETEDEIDKRNMNADVDMLKMCNFLDYKEIPYLCEESGSPHSYHIWVFVKPINGKIAKHFAHELQKEAGIECEVFPKQSSIGKDGYGNLVKVPFATHQVHKTRSSVFVCGESVSEIKDLNVEILDLSDYKIPERKVVEKADKVVSIEYKGRIRPCIESALNKQLTGRHGHLMRIAVCREYYNSGVKDPVKLVDLFRKQEDFSYEESMKGVLSIISKDSKNVRCSKLRIEASMFVNCDECELYGRRKTELML